MTLTEEGKPFAQHLNFDKASAGLVLLALIAPRTRPASSRATGSRAS